MSTYKFMTIPLINIFLGLKTLNLKLLNDDVKTSFNIDFLMYTNMLFRHDKNDYFIL